jgi:hypothetical protein
LDVRFQVFVFELVVDAHVHEVGQVGAFEDAPQLAEVAVGEGVVGVEGDVDVGAGAVVALGAAAVDGDGLDAGVYPKKRSRLWRVRSGRPNFIASPPFFV